jgi:hypothetical protein
VRKVISITRKPPANKARVNGTASAKASMVTTGMTGAIRQRLLNHSTAINTDPNLVLIWYGLERFLYRLSVSTHSERFGMYTSRDSDINRL